MVRARRLSPGEPGGVDAFVRLTCGNHTRCTAVVARESNPSWGEEFFLDVASEDNVLVAHVHDKRKDASLVSPTSVPFSLIRSPIRRCGVVCVWVCAFVYWARQ